MEQQFHHLGIAMRSQGQEAGCQGYTNDEMTDIWAAANATQTNILMQLSSPHPLEDHMVRVQLPVATEECLANKVSAKVRCSNEKSERVGDSKGVCDEPPQVMQRLVVDSLLSMSNDEEEGIQSPALDVLSALSLSEWQIKEIYDIAQKRSSDEWAVDPRDGRYSYTGGLGGVVFVVSRRMFRSHSSSRMSMGTSKYGFHRDRSGSRNIST